MKNLSTFTNEKLLRDLAAIESDLAVCELALRDNIDEQEFSRRKRENEIMIRNIKKEIEIRLIPYHLPTAC